MEDSGKKVNVSSRREVLKLGAYAVGAVALAGSAEAQVAKKASQEKVHYEHPSTKSGKHCSICQHFIAPSSCRVVDGTIYADGVCILFAKKA